MHVQFPYRNFVYYKSHCGLQIENMIKLTKIESQNLKNFIHLSVWIYFAMPSNVTSSKTCSCSGSCSCSLSSGLLIPSLARSLSR